MSDMTRTSNMEDSHKQGLRFVAQAVCQQVSCLAVLQCEHVQALEMPTAAEAHKLHA